MMRMSHQGFQNRFDLHQTFPGPEDHLREALAQLAVVIHMGKAQIFKGQGLERLQGRGDTQAARLHVL
jgi:hypothetical protein